MPPRAQEAKVLSLNPRLRGKLAFSTPALLRRISLEGTIPIRQLDPPGIFMWFKKNFQNHPRTVLHCRTSTSVLLLYSTVDTELNCFCTVSDTVVSDTSKKIQALLSYDSSYYSTACALPYCLYEVLREDVRVQPSTTQPPGYYNNSQYPLKVAVWCNSLAKSIVPI